MPAGNSRAYATVSTYLIDEVGLVAQDISEFDNKKMLSSTFCSSVYTEIDGSMLVDYAVAGVGTGAGPASPFANGTARLVGVTPSNAIAFDFEYPSNACGTSFNAQVIRLESLSF